MVRGFFHARSQEVSMLEIQGLRKSYGNNLAVDDVNFTVPDGQGCT